MSTRVENPVGPRDPKIVYHLSEGSSVKITSDELLDTQRSGLYIITNKNDLSTAVHFQFRSPREASDPQDPEPIILTENQAVELPVIKRGESEEETQIFTVKVKNMPQRVA